ASTRTPARSSPTTANGAIRPSPRRATSITGRAKSDAVGRGAEKNRSRDREVPGGAQAVGGDERADRRPGREGLALDRDHGRHGAGAARQQQEDARLHVE